MNDRDQVISEIDSLIDTYYAEDIPLPDLLIMRRKLAVWVYRLTAHVKSTHREAGTKYLHRKYRIAEHIVDARSADAKAPINFLELSAQKLPSVLRAQEEEISAEADKEMLIARLRAAGNVLQAMSQDIAEMRQEKGGTHNQSEGA